MYPRLFEVPAPWIGTITVYTYGVLLAAAYLLGLKFAMVRAKARGLDAVRVLDLGIYIIISALVGAKLLLLVTERKGRPFAGRTFWLYMFLYAVSRFIIEFYRGDERGTIFMFSTSQFISLVLAPLAIVMPVYLARHEAPVPELKRKPRKAA